MKRRRRHESRTAVADLPLFVLLLQIALRTGLGPRRAFMLAARRHRSNRFDGVADALRLGVDLTDAVSEPRGEHALVAGELRLLELLRRSESDGLDLDVHLEMLLQDSRRDRALALDEAAQRLSVSLLFPLVLCVLPAFVLLAIVPLLLDVLSQLPR